MAASLRYLGQVVRARTGAVVMATRALTTVYTPRTDVVVTRLFRPFLVRRSSNYSTDPPSTGPGGEGGGYDDRVLYVNPPLPPFAPRVNESMDQKRARLLYQSRKRGIKEMDLILSTFAAKYLHTFSDAELGQYDEVINRPSNDWDLYYWFVGERPVPPEFSCEMLTRIQKHTRNEERERRMAMPEIIHRHPAM